ncbi:hypothetical protein B9057_04950 [Aestuarium zhoushanense]|nr:hypothetical protein B9057_04950 [Aestuarium zhoushanense]
MAQSRWHTIRNEGVVTHARRLPAHFDVSAETTFPLLRRGRLATQIRQDLWRALKGLRGFSPVVEVRTQEGGLVVRAGGSVAGPFPATSTQSVIADLLTDTTKRARWVARSQITQSEV